MSSVKLSSSQTVSEKAQIDVERLLNDFLQDVQPFLRSKHCAFVSKNLGDLPQNMQGLHCSQPWLCYWTLQAADLLGILPQLFQTVPPEAIAAFLQLCFSTAPHPESGQQCGGYSGGPGQLPHLATTYAAVCSLCILGSEATLKAIDIPAITLWFQSLRQGDGGFAMHWGGECDVRASYCISVVVTLLGIPPDSVFVMPQSAEFVARCQTFEGGLACSPLSTEAHGGYAQCGLSALLLMGRFDLLDVPSLRRWLANRQFEFEGGFSGRTNKLVDSCYSHWIGTSHVLLRVGEAQVQMTRSQETPIFDPKKRAPLTATDMMLLDLGQCIDISTVFVPSPTVDASSEEEKNFASSLVRAMEFEQTTAKEFDEFTTEVLTSGRSGAPAEVTADRSSEDSFENIPFLMEEVGDFYFNQRKLQDYVFKCCQNVTKGGLMDKPEHPNDFYHTCYAMSGVSSAQNLQYLAHCRVGSEGLADSAIPYVAYARSKGWIPGASQGHGVVVPFDPLTVKGAMDKTCVLRPTNPIFNITKDKVTFALRTFQNRTFV